MAWYHEHMNVPVVGVEPTLKLFLGQPPLPVGIHRLGYIGDVSTTLRRICERDNMEKVYGVTEPSCLITHRDDQDQFACVK